MSQQKELPRMPKMDKAGKLALEVLAIKDEIKGLRESINKKIDELCNDLTAQNRASVRVNFNGENYTIEAVHIDAQDKILVKKG